MEEGKRETVEEEGIGGYCHSVSHDSYFNSNSGSQQGGMKDMKP